MIGSANKALTARCARVVYRFHTSAPFGRPLVYSPGRSRSVSPLSTSPWVNLVGTKSCLAHPCVSKSFTVPFFLPSYISPYHFFFWIL